MKMIYLPEACLAVNLEQITLVKFALHEAGLSATLISHGSSETCKAVGADISVLLSALNLEEAAVLRDAKLKVQAARADAEALR